MSPPQIIFTRHAEDMLIERRIRREWVERALSTPQSVETDPRRQNVLRAYLQIPERRGLWLRVVYQMLGTSTKINHGVV